jgi:hypothetical protein
MNNVNSGYLVQGPDMNREHSEYKSTDLPLHRPCSMGRNISILDLITTCLSDISGNVNIFITQCQGNYIMTMSNTFQ